MKPECKGAALAVALVLLAGLSALGLAAAAAAVTALALAGHQQGAVIALEAAEAGVAHALLAAGPHPGPAASGPLPHSVGGRTQAQFEARTMELDGNGAFPAGFSIGATDTAFHSQNYQIVSTGQATRNVRVRLEQGFYVVVPNQ
jgi:hypothetical protein